MELLFVVLSVQVVFQLPIRAATDAETFLPSKLTGALVKSSDRGDAKGSAAPVNVCSTKGCVLAASNLLQAMNTSADPCNNFFEYSCGKWIRDHPIPDDMDSYGTTQALEEVVTVQLRDLLESSTPSPSRAISMARIVYRACLNTTRMDDDKSKPLRAAIDALGGWPLLNPNSWNRTDFDLTKFISDASSEYEDDLIFETTVTIDIHNTSRNIIYVDQGDLGLGSGSRDYYLEEKSYADSINAYKQYQRDIVDLLLSDGNASRSEKDLDQDMKELFEFEKKIAQVTVPEDGRRNETRLYNLRTVESLNGLLPQLDWLRFFRGVLPNGVNINNETTIVVKEPKFLEDISKLLKVTDERILANYLQWQFVLSWIGTQGSRFHDAKQKFDRVLKGRQMKAPRWRTCVSVVRNKLPLATGALFVREYFGPAEKSTVLEMVDNLQAAFKEIVLESDWIDNTTKEVAIDKADAMLNFLGYPDVLESDEKLDANYDNLTLSDEDSYFELLRRTEVWSQEKVYSKLHEKADRREYNEFIASPAEVNAFNMPNRNAIMFPAGILMPPLFSSIYPKMYNFGSAGAIIGHEITHSFDDHGSQFDKEGNLRNWWTKATYESFSKRKECIVEQYSTFEIPNTKIKGNGNLTQGENIADLGGLKEAFRAYSNYVQKEGEEARLPGLQHLSNQQIFFLSFANSFCDRSRPAWMLKQALTDEHPLNIFRINGVVSNLQEFATAFHCPAGSKMSPVKRCSVW